MIVFGWFVVSFFAALALGRTFRRSPGPPDQWRRYRGVMELRKQAPPLQPLAPRRRA